jgi:hypothetical protein
VPPAYRSHSPGREPSHSGNGRGNERFLSLKWVSLFLSLPVNENLGMKKTPVYMFGFH